jgi:hypothetical protein
VFRNRLCGESLIYQCRYPPLAPRHRIFRAPDTDHFVLQWSAAMKLMTMGHSLWLGALTSAAIAASALPASAQTRLFPQGTDCSRLSAVQMTTCRTQLGIEQPTSPNPFTSGVTGTINSPRSFNSGARSVQNLNAPRVGGNLPMNGVPSVNGAGNLGRSAITPSTNAPVNGVVPNTLPGVNGLSTVPGTSGTALGAGGAPTLNSPGMNGGVVPNTALPNNLAPSNPANIPTAGVNGTNTAVPNVAPPINSTNPIVNGGTGVGTTNRTGPGTGIGTNMGTGIGGVGAGGIGAGAGSGGMGATGN